MYVEEERKKRGEGVYERREEGEKREKRKMKC